MVNTLHLTESPGTSLVSRLGGIHTFMGWNRPVAADSGGFQVFSLLAESPNSGSITRKGFTYRQGKKKRSLTPEKCIQKQVMIGADILFCLDHCTHPDEPEDAQIQSVDHTIEWARKCKAEYTRLMDQGTTGERKPLLYGIVQGGENIDLRRRCAEALLEIGFDGYGYGGWPINTEGGLVDAVGYVAELVPEHLPKHALGIGSPANVVRGFELGYDTFDCVLPTRDARHKRLYTFTETPIGPHGDFYRYLYIEDERYARDPGPLDETCNCLCCKRYTRAYLHHLFQINDSAAYRLATIHNLSFYSRLIHHLRSSRP